MAERHAGEIAESVQEAMDRARELVGSRGLVVVTGSIFLVGPARAYLLGLECDPPIDL
jgi:folylpolyglutamate synthase/dihydropteroate synthase